MKKLFVTIIAGVSMLGFTSCEQDQIIPSSGSGEHQDSVVKVGPQSILDTELQGPVSISQNEDTGVNEVYGAQPLIENEVNTPVLEPALSIVFDMEEDVQVIED